MSAVSLAKGGGIAWNDYGEDTDRKPLGPTAFAQLGSWAFQGLAWRLGAMAQLVAG